MASKKVLVPLMNGFEETEYIATRDVLIRQGIDVDSISLTGDNLVNASHSIKVSADFVFGKNPISVTDYDGIFIPGGAIGVENLDKSLDFDAMINEFVANNKVIGAICAAPTLLAKRGFLKEKNATCFPDKKFINVLTKNDVKYTDEVFVIDNNFVTGKDYLSSLEYGFELAKIVNDWKS